MRQVIVSAFGGPEHLVIEERPEPHAGDGQVRVRVHAAGLNPVDAKIAEGGPTAERFGVTPPFGNGNDFAGVVDEAGAGSGWSVGDRVYGGARFHAQAEFVLVDDPAMLNPTPAGLPDQNAAVLDIAGRTAIAGIAALGLSASDTVLVSAAAGGVGVLAVQLARRAGSRVLAIASEPNHAALAALGAVPLAYGAGLEDRVRATAPGGVSAVFDGHGAEYLDLGLRLGVAPERMNTVADRSAAARVGAQTKGRGDLPTDAIRPLADLVASSEVVAPIAAVYPMDRVADAYRHLASGPRFGKIVLDIR